MGWTGLGTAECREGSLLQEDKASGSFARVVIMFLANQHIPSLWPQGLIPDGHVTKTRPMTYNLGAFSWTKAGDILALHRESCQ